MRKLCPLASTASRFGMLLSILMSVFSHTIYAQCPSNSVSGSVFLDSNLDGSISQSEQGLSNLMLNAYDSDGIFVSSTTTNSDGEYQFLNLDSGSYRFELSYTSNYSSSQIGENHKSVIQFSQTGNCDLHFGLKEASISCASNPDIMVTCFVRGDFNENSSYATIVGLEHDFGPASNVQVYATKQETGSIWGLSSRPSRNEVYSSAFVKQYASLTPSGHDAIFKTDLTTGTTALFTELSSLGVNTGTLSVTDPMACNYGAQVGKFGIGNIAVSQNEESLYAVNLFDNTLVKISLDNPTPATTSIYNIPNPGCTAGFPRAFALEFHNGKYYVGVTCDAMGSKNENDSSATVYEFNPASGSFTQIFQTNYIKGYWLDNPSDQFVTSHWLTDIDFTDEGNMLLAITDRIGHRFCNANTGRIDQQYPDLLVVWNDNGIWKLESNGTAGPLSGTGVGNNQGPNGGEFFGNDFYAGDPNYHSEVALGSVLALPGTGEVIASVYDPLYNTYSGGLHRYKTNNGSLVNIKELYTYNISEYFGKSTGFGEIIALCPSASPEIGNYVWEDADGDGIQDANEKPISDLPLLIFDRDCNELGSTTTDRHGNYSFNNSNVTGGILANTQYFIAIDPVICNESANVYTLNGVNYNPTRSNVDTNLGSDLISNPGVCPEHIKGFYLPVSLGSEQSVDHSYDIGLLTPNDFDLALMKTVDNADNVRLGDELTFSIEIFNQGNIAAASVEITDYITENFEFNPLNNLGWSEVDGNLKYTHSEILIPGASFTVDLKLTVVDNNIKAFANYAEISNTVDQFGSINNDNDSHADDNPLNDTGAIPNTSTDNEIYDDGTNDEDDHDVAQINVLDIALRKVASNTNPYTPLDFVTYNISIFNQGNVDILSYTVADYYPSYLDFDPALNPGWTDNGNNVLTYDYNGLLAIGEAVSIPVTFQINGFDENGEIRNIAEISEVSGGSPNTRDFDSNPDQDMNNDNLEDDMIDDMGENDEDDHDIAVITSLNIDLALIKTVDQSLVRKGEDVLFTIHVINQGEVTVKDIEIVDYLPEGLTLIDPNWSVNSVGDKAFRTINIPNGLAPGEDVNTTILFRVNQDADIKVLINFAEIYTVIDLDGKDVGNFDIDSKPDDIKSNDNGGDLGDIYDDFTRGNGEDDEDDSDPAKVYVVEYEITEPCICLNNSTTTSDGQFGETIVVTAPSAQTWNIDYVNGLFDSSSSAPPAIPTPFVTGFSGYSLSEFPLGTGYSEYTLTGIHIDGQGYDIRLVNEFGYFLQISSEGCTYADGTIQSEENPFSACINSTQTYETELAPGCIVNWTLSGGGVISGPANLESVTVDWGSVRGNYTLTANLTCPSDCDKPTFINVNLGSAIGPIACHGELNVSLDGDCSVEITPEMVLSITPDPFAGYGVMLLDPHGDPMPDNIVTAAEIGQDLMIKIIDACSGNSCWSTLTVEDKYAPVIQCDDITIDCNSLKTYEPIANDNCGTVDTIIMISEVVTPYDCHPIYVKEVTRSYIAKDSYGNTSQPCEQTIYVERFDFDAIVCPPNYLVNPEEGDLPALACGDITYNEDGTPDISITGVPTYFGWDIYPFPDYYCNVGIEYEDYIISETGCVKKYMRTWTFYEAWCGIGEYVQCTQTIEIQDLEAPTVVCDSDITISTNGESCERTVELPLPTSISDDCTTEGFVIDIAHPNGFLDNVTGNGDTFVTLSAGTHTVTYNVYDECQNLSTCTVDIVVRDETNPVAICDEFTTIGLRGDGSAEAYASVFDDGSYDDCNLYKSLVRRMDHDVESCPCEIPYFSDMHYLGEYEGHYYYLSKSKMPGYKAYWYSNAMGGHPAIIETADEDAWIRTQADSLISGDEYYIGLNDIDEEGTFVWNNNLPLNYNNWNGGSPVNIEDYVITNADGTWSVTSAAREEAYIMEVSDRCGWSEKVNFCCADLGTDHMVVYRVVDYFGNTNMCMVTTEIQDKIPPQVNCPQDLQVDCDYAVDFAQLNELFGEATAIDACNSLLIELPYIDNRDQCGVGEIKRTWQTADANGFDVCEQVITFVNNNPFDGDNIVWPEDYTSYEGCNTDNLHPDNLDAPYDYPIVDEQYCTLLATSWSDELFFFTSPDDNACFKLLRTWEIIDWCTLDENDSDLNEYDEASDDGITPGYWRYQQTIKINDVVPPTITGCEDIEVCTFECDGGDVTLVAVGDDTCTPDDILNNSYEIDFDSDGIVDLTVPGIGNEIVATGYYPVGEHTILYTFEDGCGNMNSCLKRFTINNCKPPTAACIEGLSIGLEPMDLDGDDIPDTEMACVWAESFDASSLHPCGYDITIVFCDDPANPDLNDTEKCFDCTDCGTQTVNICVIDEFGNVDFCVTTIEVQDNNDVDFCPDPADCIIAPSAPVIAACETNFDPSNIGGIPTIDPNCFCDESEFDISFNDVIQDPSSDPNCVGIIRTWTVTPNCGCIGEPAQFVQEIEVMDFVSPVIACAPDILGVSANANCEAFVNVPVPVIFGTCSSNLTLTHNSIFATNPTGNNASGTYPIGETNVVFTVVDACGNPNSCTIMIEVVDDTAPVCNVDNISVELDENDMAVVSVNDFENGSSDNCSDNGDLTFTFQDASNTMTVDCADIGNTTVTIIATDEAGNMTSCTATLTVTELTDPVCNFVAEFDAAPITVANGNVTVDVSDLDLGTSDNCTAVTFNPTSFTYNCSDLGANMETITVSDLNGNSTQCPVIINVTDLVAPTCDVPDITVDVAGNSYTVTISDFDVSSASDGCGSEIIESFTPVTFDCSDVGNTVSATVFVTDENGNMGQCNPTITIENTGMPTCNFVAEFDADPITAANGSVTVLVSDLDLGSDDPCNVLTYDPLSFTFDCDDIGANTETITVSNASGVSTQCTVIINVSDQVAPTCSVPDITVDVQGNEYTVTIADFNVDSASDACGTEITESFDPITYDCDDLGQTFTVAVIVTDEFGNQGQCNPTVTIMDSAMPICNIVDSVDLCLDENGEAVLTESMVDLGSTAGCSTTPIITLSQNMFLCNPLGPQTVTVTVALGTQSCEEDITVNIIDKLAPTIVCPPDMTIDCSTDISDLSVFGEAVATDNCVNGTEIEEIDVQDIGDCGFGTIVRSFTATDAAGNVSAQCSQTITIQNLDPLVEADITWPTTPVMSDCVNGGPTGEPLVNTASAGCAVVSVSSVDVVNNPNNDCSYSIIRTWTVSDLCQDADFTFDQTINVVDLSDPTILPIPAMDMDVEACSTDITFSISINDDCTLSDDLFTVTSDYFGEHSIVDSDTGINNGVFTFSGEFCDGTQVFNIIAQDGCGNSVSREVTVNINGRCAKPSCKKIGGMLTPEGTDTLFANDFGDFPANQTFCPISEFDFSFSTDINDTLLLVSCDPLNGFPADTIITSSNIFVNLYIWENGMLIDSCKNIDRPAAIAYENFGEVCGTLANAGSIQGRVLNPNSIPVDDVEVDLMGSDFVGMMTSSEGYYAFPTMEFGGNYAVAPKKDSDPLNGVSTLDIILMQQHILGVKTFENPYQYIAGDVNNSGKISSVDLVQLRKLILGFYDEFPDNTSWRMVDAEYEFPLNSDPLAQAFPEEYHINEFNQNMNVNFVGVKIGDINNSAIANANHENVELRSNSVLKLQYENVNISEGEVFEIEISAEVYPGIQGAQFELAIDTDYAKDFSIEILDNEILGNENFNFTDVENGIIGTSWHMNKSVTVNREIKLFKVIAKALRTGTIENAINLINNNITPEAYAENNPIDLALIPNNYSNEDLMLLYQNNPNPWSEKTTISFYVPSDQKVEINLFDVTGSQIKHFEIDASTGGNQIEISKEDIPATGVIYYELVSKSNRITKKMLLLR